MACCDHCGNFDDEHTDGEPAIKALPEYQPDLYYYWQYPLEEDYQMPNGYECLGEMEGRKQAMFAIEALKKYNPGCEEAKLRNFGMTLGIRDTRKIDAAYNMTTEDVHNEAKFEDTIGIFPEFIDGYGVLVLPTTGRYFQLPYRSMLPKGVENLLVTGRSVGGDRGSHAAVRNMMCCAVNGQGAGVAAAVSIQTNSDVSAVDIKKVQQTLLKQGARIH